HTRYNSDSQSSKTVRWISILSRLAMLINGSVPVRSGRIEALLSDSTIAQSKSISIPRTGLSFSLTTRILFAEISL
ncbi:hypothetical protein BX070DRAFT_220970, partial [Coemansia spiralis]